MWELRSEDERPLEQPAEADRDHAMYEMGGYNIRPELGASFSANELR